MDIKLLATDLDGTLLNSDGHISPRTRQALNDATQNGLHVIFATGRPPRLIPDVLDQCDIKPLVVSANGSIIIDTQNEIIINHHLLNAMLLRKTMQELNAFANESHLEYGYALEMLPAPDKLWDHFSTFFYEESYVLRWEIANIKPTADLETYLHSKNIIKALFRLKNQIFTPEIYDWILQAENIIHRNFEPTISEIDSPLIEISPIDVNKAQGLDWISNHLNIPWSNIATVGDMFNDIAMLRRSPHPFVVSNAHTEVLKLGTIIGYNDEDAVASLIYKLLNA